MGVKPYMVGIVLIGLVAAGVAVIFSIFPRQASVDAGRCVPGSEELAGFEAADPRKPVPRQIFVDGGGAERTIDYYRGRGVVMNFWATWCTPCVREMPALDRLRAAVDGAGVAVIALSEDRGGPEVVEKFFRRHGIGNLPVLMDRRQGMLGGLGVLGLPTTVLVDRGGNEVGRVVGVAEWDTAPAIAFLRRCLGVAEGS